jgi:hypothetical protein
MFKKRGLKSRIFAKFFSAGSYSAEESAKGPSATGPSALSAQNSSNSSHTAEQLVAYLGYDIDLFDIDSVKEADHVRLQQLKAVGEQWGEASRIDVEGPGVRGWGADSAAAQLVQIACHAANVIRPKPSPALKKPPGTDRFLKLQDVDSSLPAMVEKGVSLYYCETAGKGVVVVCVRAGGTWKDWVINGGFGMSEVERSFIVSWSDAFFWLSSFKFGYQYSMMKC